MYTEIKIDWKIATVNEKIDNSTFECWLNGVDEKGNKYIANALQVCGEIENISDIELVEPYRVASSKFLGDNKYEITFNKSLEHAGRFRDIEDGLNNSINNF